MSDNVIELNIFTAAQYWEAQADMWHANYADAQKENEKLRGENDAWRMDGASCSEEVKRLRAENEKLRAKNAEIKSVLEETYKIASRNEDGEYKWLVIKALSETCDQ